MLKAPEKRYTDFIHLSLAEGTSIAVPSAARYRTAINVLLHFFMWHESV